LGKAEELIDCRYAILFTDRAATYSECKRTRCSLPLPSRIAQQNGPISVVCLAEMPIPSCEQSVSAPRGKAGARLNAHTELRAKRQRSAREAISRTQPLARVRAAYPNPAPRTLLASAAPLSDPTWREGGKTTFSNRPKNTRFYGRFCPLFRPFSA
jgi:hypothetical protein